MKKLLFVAAIASLMAAKCSKNDTPSTCTPVEPVVEDAAMLAYANAKGITPVKLSSGMYYQITNQGTGVMPTSTSNVRAQYTGKFLNNDSTFDSNNSLSGASFSLGGVIQGWQMGLPLLKSGGTIKLLIPSKYAYSCTGSGSIPANTPLFFEIKLLAVF